MPSRPPAVAGAFYPDDPYELREMLRSLLAGVEVPTIESLHGVVAPHAGLIYSGRVAAHAHALLAQHRPKRVLLLGPSHHAPFRAAALDDHNTWRTPLGEVRIADPGGLVEHHLITTLPQAHAPEHCLEVQLPFLQTLLPEAEILPLLVGQLTFEDAEHLTGALEQHLPGVPWLVSSDLSHFKPNDAARKIDRETLRILEEVDIHSAARLDACGLYPLLLLLTACAQHNYKPRLLKYATSADASGDTRQVVGYASLWW